MNVLAPYLKAIVGFIAPGAVILTSAVQAGSDGGVFVTQGELITAACATVITAAAVYATPNKPASPAERRDMPEHRA
ncbi:hypothetical protein [Arthrobacter sp. MP_2.3]|uniref:hypothetical protein n=1 Tax=Arthrobacter sp. MP_2.3 TaxID=3349633 RepID=UPI0038D51029